MAQSSKILGNKKKKKSFMTRNPNWTFISLSHDAISMIVRCPRPDIAEFGLFKHAHKEPTTSSEAPIPCAYLKRESTILLGTRIQLSSFSRVFDTRTIEPYPDDISSEIRICIT